MKGELGTICPLRVFTGRLYAKFRGSADCIFHHPKPPFDKTITEGQVPESVGYEVVMPVAFDHAMTKTRDALKAEGFGVLTEIDLQAAFREKLGRDFRRYTILGACNPPLAFAAVSADPQIGLLLPCNVTVEEDSSGSAIVRLVDPRSMLSAAPGGLSPELATVAEDAHQRIEKVTAALRTVKA